MSELLKPGVKVEGNKVIISFSNIKGEFTFPLEKIGEFIDLANEQLNKIFETHGVFNVDIDYFKTQLKVIGKEPDYSKIYIRKKERLLDVKHFYTYSKWDLNGSFHHGYRIYRAEYAVGNPPIYIFTEPEKELQEFEQYLPIIPLSDNDFYDSNKNLLIPTPNPEILKELKKVVNPDITIPNPLQIWTAIIQRHINNVKSGNEPFFFKLGTMTDTEIEEIKKWNFEELEKIYFYEGYSKPEKLVYAYRCQRITFIDDPLKDEIACAKAQRYNSHVIIILRTKIGKTTTGGKIGRLYNAATSARLCGFSTADSTYPGEIHGLTVPIIGENVHEWMQGTLNLVLEAMELGIVRIGKGRKAVYTRTGSAFILHANPPGTDQPSVLAESFVKVATLMVTIALGAVGSRFAMILFGANKSQYPDAKMLVKIPDEDIAKNKYVFNYIIDEVNKEVIEVIFPNSKVQDWLERPIDDSYRSIIHSFLVGDILAQKGVVEFWIDYPSAFRHIRGMALKQAIMDNLKAVFIKQYDIDKILQDAEVHVERILNISIDSMREMLSTIKTEPLEEQVYKKYESLGKDNLKAIVMAVAAYTKINPTASASGMSVPLSLAGTYYDAGVSQNQKIKSYQYFSRIPIPTKFDRINNTDFGFKIVKMGTQNDPTVVFENNRQLLALANKLKI